MSNVTVASWHIKYIVYGPNRTHIINDLSYVAHRREFEQSSNASDKIGSHEVASRVI